MNGMIIKNNNLVIYIIWYMYGEGVLFFIFANFLQAVTMWIPHFRRSFQASGWFFSFPVSHFRENERWGPLDPPLSSFKVEYFKTFFLKKIVKKCFLVLYIYIYMSVFTYHRHLLGNLALHFLGKMSINMTNYSHFLRFILCWRTIKNLMLVLVTKEI